MTGSWRPKTRLGAAVWAAGFEYNPDENIIQSRMYPLQRLFGFAFAYDYSAPATISALIDCEPIFFTCEGKDWMIELWKGQYGIQTGGEVGIYNRPTNPSAAEAKKLRLLDSTIGQRPHDKDPTHSRYFACPPQEDLLRMSFVLHHNGRRLFARGPEDHWWLTGFKWGVLSRAEEITMDITIRFKDPWMLAAFDEAYPGTKIDAAARTAEFTFDRPTSWQPRTDPRLRNMTQCVQQTNAAAIKLYNSLGLKSNDPNLIVKDAAVHLEEYFLRFMIQLVQSPRDAARRLLKDAAVTAYRTAEILKGGVCVLKESAKTLEDLLVLKLSAAETARVLKGEGVSLSEIASVLKDVFGQSPLEAAKILKANGAGFTQVAQLLKSVYRQDLRQVAGILRSIGASERSVRDALVKVFRPSPAELREALKGR